MRQIQTEISPEAAAAVETLRTMQPQMQVVDFGGHWRLRRGNCDSWYLGPISDDKWSAYNAAAIKGLEMAKKQIADQAARAKLPRHTLGTPADSSSAK